MLSCVLISKEKELEVIEMHSSGEFFLNKDQGKVKLERTCRLVYNNNYRLCIDPEIQISSTKVLDSSRNTTKEIIRKDTTYIVYAFVDGAKDGLHYDLSKPNQASPLKFNVDSMLEQVVVSKRAFESFNHEFGEPLQVIRTGKKLVEKYLVKKAGMLDADSVFRYYNDDLKDVKFSFSPSLNAKKKSKLYKTLYIQNPIPKGISGIDIEIPRREVFYEIRLIQDKDQTEYRRIIDRFKRDNGANH